MARMSRRLTKFTRVKLYEDYNGTIYEVDIPLSCNVKIEQISKELGIPDYLEIKNLAINRAITTIWACLNASKLKLSEDLQKKVKGPLSPLLFGGMAVKFHSPSANKPNGPLNRHVKDVDFVVPKREGALLVKIMLEMGNLFGSYYLFFTTQGEKWFNLLRGGKRFRVRGICDIIDNTPEIGVVDIFCEELPFRHNIKNFDFERAKDNLYTIGLENILLSKCQFIFDMPKEKASELKEADQDFRILPYEHLKDKIVVGMELKDFKDVAAILLDHEVGEGPEKINISQIKKTLKNNKKFSLTFQLNLNNLVNRLDILRREGLNSSQLNKIMEVANQILKGLPIVDKKWEKPWWNIDIETPKIRL